MFSVRSFNPFVGALLCAAVATLIAAFSTPASAAPPRPAAVIPLEPYLDTLWSFHAKVNGHDARFLFDTGGGITVVSPESVADFGCKPWGKVTGYRMRGDRVDSQRCDDVNIDVAGLRLHAPTGIIFNFAGILPKDAPPIAGSVALDAFVGRAVTLDLTHRQLIVETPASLRARIAHAREVPVIFERDAAGLALSPVVGVETSQGRAWMEFDSGSDAPLIVGRHVAAPLGLDPTIKGNQMLHARLAGGAPFEAKTLVQDLIVDGDIGNPVLKQWVITIDLAHTRLWVAPAVAAGAGGR